jgi:hypothetical protein
MQKALDDELAHKGALPEPPEAAVGFAGQWHRLLLERQRLLELEKARKKGRHTGISDPVAISAEQRRDKGKGLE